MGQHQYEQESDDDGTGVDDDGRGHQERSRQQHEQAADVQDDQRERQCRPGRVGLRHQQGAGDDRQAGEDVKEHRLDRRPADVGRHARQHQCDDAENGAEDDLSSLGRGSSSQIAAVPAMSGSNTTRNSAKCDGKAAMSGSTRMRILYTPFSNASLTPPAGSSGR